MATFANTTSPTPFALFDTDTKFISDADSVFIFVKRSLGDDVLSVELTKKQIWSCFENATLEFSALVNSYQAKAALPTLLGSVLLTGSDGNYIMRGAENSYFVNNLEFINRQAAPFAGETGVGGDYAILSASFETVEGTQDYDLQEAIPSSISGGRKAKIYEVFHYDPLAAYRFFDAASTMGYLSNEFNFESYTPDTIFYILPVFEDVLRAGSLKLSNKVRRSNYSFEIRNNKLRLYPIPITTKTIWFKYTIVPDPVNPYNTASGSAQHGLPHNYYGTTGTVNSIANAPYGILPYNGINAIGKAWIFKFTLAMCKEVLGLIRGKFNSIPIPNAEVTLNFSELLSSGKDEQNKLKDDLRTYLDEMTYDKLAEREANKAEQIERTLKGVPLGIYVG